MLALSLIFFCGATILMLLESIGKEKPCFPAFTAHLKKPKEMLKTRSEKINISMWLWKSSEGKLICVV